MQFYVWCSFFRSLYIRLSLYKSKRWGTDLLIICFLVFNIPINWIDSVCVCACVSDTLMMSYNWIECLICGGWVFQRKSLSCFHHSSSTSLSSYIVCHSFVSLSLCFYPFYHPLLSLSCCPLCSSSLLPSSPSHSLLSSFPHLHLSPSLSLSLCSLPMWARFCQNLLCVCVCLCVCVWTNVSACLFALRVHLCICVCSVCCACAVWFWWSLRLFSVSMSACIYSQVWFVCWCLLYVRLWVSVHIYKKRRWGKKQSIYALFPFSVSVLHLIKKIIIKNVFSQKYNFFLSLSGREGKGK